MGPDGQGAATPDCCEPGDVTVSVYGSGDFLQSTHSFNRKNKKGKKERPHPFMRPKAVEFGGEQEALERVMACVDRWHGGEVGMCEGEGGQSSPVPLIC